MHEYKSMLFKNQKDVDPKCPTWVNPVKPLYLTIDLFSTYYCITISLIHLCWRTRALSAAPVAKLLRLISSDSVTGLDLKAASSHFSAGLHYEESCPEPQESGFTTAAGCKSSLARGNKRTMGCGEI